MQLFILCSIFALATVALSRPFQERPVKRFSLIATERLVWADGNPILAVVFNNSLPGPEIRVECGDRVLINVTNALLDKNLTMHLHGLSQRMTPASDGTPLVSQWPIAPGNWFEYELTVDAADQGATYYHSHVGLQAMTAYGPLIVDCRRPRAYRRLQEERTLMLGDWFWKDATTLAQGLLGKTFIWPGSSKAILLNGRAIDACDADVAQFNANMTCADTETMPAVIPVPYDTDVRLRLIGALTLSYTSFGILNHPTLPGTSKLTIIAVDGAYIEPLANRSHVEILPGQRYDVLLHTKSTDVVKTDGSNGCYWIRMESRWRNPPAGGWGILAYPTCSGSALDETLRAGPPLPSNTTTSSATLLPAAVFGWISAQFAPLRWSGAPRSLRVPHEREVQRRIVIEAQQIGVFGTPENGTGIRFAENGHVDDHDRMSRPPYLIQLYERSIEAPSYERAMRGTPKGFDNQTNTYVARSGEVFDVVIVNQASKMGHNVEVHPWHSHSLKQWTIASGMGSFSEEALSAARAQGFRQPIARDTHTVWPGPGASFLNETLPTDAAGGWTMIRYRVAKDGSDGGAWMLHCHILFHQLIGMVVPIIFDAPNLLAASGFDDDPAYLKYGFNVTSRYTRTHGRAQ